MERLGMFLPDNADKMRQILLHMFTWRRNPVLHHGDMRLKNIIVDQHGSIAGGARLGTAPRAFRLCGTYRLRCTI